MKASKWRSASRSIVSQLPNGEDWVVHRRFIYRRTVHWIVQGVLVDPLQYGGGVQVWRLRVAPFDCFYNLSLDWSESVGFLEGDDDAIQQRVVSDSVGLIESLPSENEDLRAITRDLKAGRVQALTRACAHLILGEYDTFLKLLHDPDLIQFWDPREAALDAVAARHRQHVARVRQLQETTRQEDAKAIVASWCQVNLLALSDAGEFGPVEFSG